jgi:hypothetical protein
MKTTPPPASTGVQTAQNRKIGTVLQFLGKGIGFTGAIVVVVGGVLPWMQLTVFNIPLAFPGMVTLWGAVAVGLAVLSLSWGRGVPWLWVAVGIACGVIGQSVAQTVGRDVVRYKLQVEQQLASVNSRLAQAAIPPLEPFPAIGTAKDHLGPGPVWVFWGGVVLTMGGMSQIVGGRLQRTCGNCGTTWAIGRTPLSYCPQCGTPLSEQSHCAMCRQPLSKSDRFCANCGTQALRNG